MAAGRQLKSLAKLKDLRERVEALAETLETRINPAERRELLRSMKSIFAEIDEVIAYELTILDATHPPTAD
jgi:hypothetical protein